MVGRKVMILQLGFWALWSSDPMAALLQNHTCERRRAVSTALPSAKPTNTTTIFPSRQQKYPQQQEGNSRQPGYTSKPQDSITHTSPRAKVAPAD